MSWPVPETMMIETTESESLSELERFCEAMIKIRGEICAIEQGLTDGRTTPSSTPPNTADLVIADWTRPYPKNLLLHRCQPHRQVLAARGAGGQCLRRPASIVRMPPMEAYRKVAAE